MLFRQFIDPQTSTHTYLLASGFGTDAIIIDPVVSACEFYLQRLADLSLTLKAVIDTHVHADHITGAGMLQQSTGADIVMGEKSQATCVTTRLADEEIYEVGGLQLKALYTPGHTDNSYCFAMSDRVFTGDTLLIRGTGRTDFQNGDARAQYHAIHSKLFTLPDDTLVYVGHDYKGETVSTIGEEKRCNPRLQVPDVEAYIALMGSLNLPQPKMLDIAAPANLRCGYESA